MERYRQHDSLLEAIPCREKLRGIPKSPFVGEAGYEDVRDVLARNRRWLTRTERLLADDVMDYLAFKGQARRPNQTQVQMELNDV